ncbi:GNAT family N-acetyltransferase [Hirschia maritima]|uniref:GNAT family N-acetyltransferase n=1 Tax=Hirschia maritima TaxID=1121961 RepID=UPI0003644DF6|nr:GNAT family protein [Hirschia maritima]
MLSGEFVNLRAIEQTDLEPLRQWRNKPEMRRFFREYREISPEMQQKWFENHVLNDPRTRMFAIERKSDSALMGACGLCYIDAINQNADFSIYLGIDDLYIDEKFASDAGKVLIQYGFEELNLHRIWAEIYSIDEPKQAFLPSLGFELEGTHRETHFTEGKWVNSLFYGLLSSSQAR